MHDGWRQSAADVGRFFRDASAWERTASGMPSHADNFLQLTFAYAIPHTRILRGVSRSWAALAPANHAQVAHYRIHTSQSGYRSSLNSTPFDAIWSAGTLPPPNASHLHDMYRSRSSLVPVNNVKLSGSSSCCQTSPWTAKYKLSQGLSRPACNRNIPWTAVPREFAEEECTAYSIEDWWTLTPIPHHSRHFGTAVSSRTEG